MDKIVPNVLTCKQTHVCEWIHTQLRHLFSGLKTYARQSQNNEYDSPMVLPASWHPQQSLHQLKTHPYFVTEKYDGVRYFLLLVSYNHKPQAFMIDRRGDIFLVSVSCQTEYFKGSLFEGELVFNSKTHRQEYYVFDVISIQGTHVHTIEDGHLFRERQQWIREIFGGVPYDKYIVNQSTAWKAFVDNGLRQNAEWTNKIISMGNHYSLQFFPKLFYALETYDPIYMTRPDIPNDGFIFTPDYCPIGVFNTNQPRIWKWKPFLTIDCWIRPTDPTVCLLYRRQREPLRFVRIHGRQVTCHWDTTTNITPVLPQNVWHIIECLVQYKQETQDGDGNAQHAQIWFIPSRLRLDKSFANSMKTFQKSLPALVEPTPIEDVFKMCALTMCASKSLQH